MRKFTIAFIFSVLAIGSVVAQGSLELLNPQLTIYGTADDPLLESNFGVKNNGSTALSVKVFRTVISEVSGSRNNICWGINCYGFSTDTTPNAQMINPGATDNSFKGDYEPQGNAGVTTIKYCFYDVNNMSDSSCVTIDFDAAPVGISSRKEDVQFQINPNPARSLVTLAYFTNGYDSRLVIRDMLGKTVRDIQLDPSQQILVFELEDLKPGVYFYNISGNGKASQSKRLVITR